MNKPKDIPFAYMISKLLSLNPHLSSSYPQWNINFCSKSYLCITALLERNGFFSDLWSQILLCQTLHKYQQKASTLSLYLEPGQMIEEPLNNLALFYDPPSQQLNNKKKVTALSCQAKQILAS